MVFLLEKFGLEMTRPADMNADHVDSQLSVRGDTVI
jgi:hypothetical protein